MKADTKQDGLRTRRLDSEDPRVLRTREKLVAAYRDLLDDRSSAAITVTAVTRGAGVPRSSFYAHFTGVDDLAALALAEFNETVIGLARTEVRDGVSKTTANERVLHEMISFVAEQRDTYGPLLARGDEFTHAVTEAIVEQTLVTLRTRTRVQGDPEITARYMGAGLIGVLVWWLEHGAHLSIDDLARALIAITPRDFTD